MEGSQHRGFNPNDPEEGSLLVENVAGVLPLGEEPLNLGALFQLDSDTYDLLI